MLYEDAAPIVASAVGLLPSDPKVMALTNRSQEELKNLGIWVGTIAEAIVCTAQRCFTLPYELESAIEVTVADHLTDISNGWYRVVNPGLYVDPEQWSDDVLVDRGEVPTFYDICTPSTLRVVTEIPEDAGKTAWFSGISSNAIVYANPGTGYVEGETVAIPTAQGGAAATTHSFDVVNKIKKSKTRGYIRIYGVPVNGSAIALLAILSPQQTEARFRRYSYPNLPLPGDGSTTRMRITGFKRFIPVSCNTDEMYIGNASAVALQAQKIRKTIQNIPDAQNYEKMAVELLTGEVKRYMLDPSNIMLRRAQWLEDEKTYVEGTLGYVRARLALEIVGAIHFGKSRLNRLIQEAQESFVMEGKYQGTTQRDISIAIAADGTVDLPVQYEAIVAASVEGVPVDIETEYYEFAPSGPGAWTTVLSPAVRWRLVDQGEVVIAGVVRRRYMCRGKTATNTCPTSVQAIFRKRFIRVTDPLALLMVPLYPAIKAMVESILLIETKEFDSSAILKNKAMKMLDNQIAQRRGGAIIRPRATYQMTTAAPCLGRSR